MPLERIIIPIRGRSEFWPSYCNGRAVCVCSSVHNIDHSTATGAETFDMLRRR